MNNLTNPTASPIRRTSAWLEIATDTYLDHRHRNWVLAEEQGDVVFVADRAVVLVHRERAEHIARALGHDATVGLVEAAVALPVSVRPTRLPASSVVHRETTAASTLTRWRAACGWLGIVAGAAVFVATLALRLDDPALVVALMLGMRGSRLILDVDS
jgi:hypothetical protein